MVFAVLVLVTLFGGLAADCLPSMATVAEGQTQSEPLTGFQTHSDDNNTTDANKTIIVNTVLISTNWGDMLLGMYDVGAPITVGNFLNLTRSGFYNGIKFHRIIDDFVIQTGDPNTKNNNPYDDGMGGSGKTIPLEVDPAITHIDGAVGMARSSDPNSASSQFYICDGPQHGLDGNYAVFGVVIDGLDTVRKIAQAPTYGNKRPMLKDHPIDDIIMNSVTVRPLEDNGTDGSESFLETFERTNPVGFDGLVYGLAGLALATGLVTVLVIRRSRRLRARRGARFMQAEETYEVETLEQ